ncbi:MAG: hypothetical protein AB7F75_09365, partial [Planctomycetota bacterium]
MGQRLVFATLLSLLLAIVAAQEFIIDEDGQPKLLFDDPLQPMELFFGTKYPTGEKNYSRTFKADDPEWSLPPMPKEKYLALNGIQAKIKKGQVDQVALLKPQGLATVPYIWNLMKEQKAVQEAVAPLAVELEGPNGDALTYSLLFSNLVAVQDTAMKKMKSRLSPDAIFGVWLRSKGGIRDKIIAMLVDKKDMKAFQDHRSKFDEKDEWKKIFDKKIPTFLQNLYIQSLIDSDFLPFNVPDKESEKFIKEFMATVRKGKADKEWVTLVALRVGDKVNVTDLEKISRNSDWYFRWTLCRALRHRPDLIWVTTPLLLERQRDECVMIRLEANRILRTMHHMPYEFKPQRTLKLDTEVVASWERWWTLREDDAKALADSESWPVTHLKPDRNLKVFFGGSPQNFDVLAGNVEKPFKARITLIDVNKDGDYTDWGIDRIGFGDVEKEPTLLLSRVVSSGTDLWFLEPDDKTMTVRFKKYTGKSALVKFTANYEKDYDPAGITVSSAPDMNFLVDFKKDTLLPLGSYFINAGWILRKGGEIARIELNKKAAPIKVDGTTPVAVTVGSELTFQLDTELVKEKNQLILKPVDVVGAAGELYMKISPQLQTISVGAYSDGNKDETRRDWTPFYLKMTTQMVGGLVPPMAEGTVQADRVNWERFKMKELRLNTELKPTRRNKETEKTQKEATKAADITEKDTIEAIPAENRTQVQIDRLAALITEIGTLTTEINTLTTEITNLTTEIDALEAENAQTLQLLQGDAGLSGRDFNDYIEALYKEEGCKLLAKALSDISWKPFPIDLSKVRGAKDAAQLKITLDTAN